MSADAETAMQAILESLGWRFTIEHLVGNFILDFHVAQFKMAIEVDGGYHSTAKQIARDRLRDRWLVGHGFVVARFTNEQVLEFPKRVKATLLARLKVKNPREVCARVLPSNPFQAQQDETQRRLMARIFAHRP